MVRLLRFSAPAISVLPAVVVAWLALPEAHGPPSESADQPPPRLLRPGALDHQAETRAIAYLAREVPLWRQENACYSCHNNGDAARALIAGLQRRHDVRPAIDDTLEWLASPARWDSNPGGKGGNDD